jgi:hypothetical protein
MTWAVGSPGTILKRIKRMVATAKRVIRVYAILRIMYSCTSDLLWAREAAKRFRAASRLKRRFLYTFLG